MDVSHPIRSVIPSLDGPVLSALAATTAPLSLAELHGRVGGRSKSGVRRVLLRLVHEGICHEVPGGYVLNREHIAAPVIELLVNLHGELVQRIRRAVEAWDGDANLVGLFGSAARRDGDSMSDIDVLVVSDFPNLPEFTDHLAESIRIWTGNRGQVIGVSAAELKRLRRAKEPILANWERDLLVISGDRRALRVAG
jgi:hypothetical protein